METEIQSNSQNIIDAAKQAEQTSGSFMQPGKTKKGNRGRPQMTEEEKAKAKAEREAKKAYDSKAEDPKKTESVSRGPQIPTKTLCLPITKVMSNVGVAVLKDKRAAMSVDEADSIAEAMAPLFDKYLPDLLGNYGAEMAFAMALGQWGLKLYAVNELKKREAQNQPQGQPNARPQANSTSGLVDSEAGSAENAGAVPENPLNS